MGWFSLSAAYWSSMFESEIAQYARCMNAYCSLLKSLELRVVSFMYSGFVYSAVNLIDLVRF